MVHGLFYHMSEGLLVPVVDEEPLRSAPGAALQRNGLPCPLCSINHENVGKGWAAQETFIILKKRNTHVKLT